MTYDSEGYTNSVGQPVPLARVRPVQKPDGWPTREDVDISGHTYLDSAAWPTSCVCCNDGQFEAVEWNLSRRYRQLRATAGVSDDSTAGKGVRIVIIGDGRTLGAWDIAVGTAATVNVPLTNVLRLRVEVRWLFPDLCHLADDPLITPALGGAQLT